MFLVFFLASTITVLLMKLPFLKSQRFLSSALAACLVSILLFGNSVAALTLNLPQLAAMGASDSALDQRQRVIDEDLKIDPTKLRYRGLEYVQFQPEAERLTDPEIKSLIKSDINPEVFAAVASGSVQILAMSKILILLVILSLKSKIFPVLEKLCLILAWKSKLSNGFLNIPPFLGQGQLSRCIKKLTIHSFRHQQGGH